MRTKAEIVEAGVFFTELYDEYEGGVPLEDVFMLAAERFTDFNKVEVAMVMLIATLVFEGRAAGVTTADYRVH
jgi:hypothetical protein